MEPLTWPTEVRLEPDLHPHNREFTNDHKRKQYKCCDHCRKRRRACDAVSLGIIPSQPNQAANPNRPKACSTCQKANKQCTFEWLRNVSKQHLVQGSKRKAKAQHRSTNQREVEIRIHTPPELDTAQNVPGLKEDHGLPTIVGNENVNTQSRPTDYKTYPLDPSKDPAIVTQLPLDTTWVDPVQTFGTINEYQDARWPIYNTSEPTIIGNPESCSWTGAAGPERGFIIGDANVCYTEVPNTGFENTLGWDNLAPTHADPYPQFSNNLTNVSAAPAIGLETFLPHHSVATTLQPSYGVPNTVRKDSTTSRSTKKSSSTRSSSSRNTRDLNLYESRLSQTTAKSAIIKGLTQVYNNSMENAISCWVTEDNCPYEKGISSLTGVFGAGSPSQMLLDKSLYQRVHQLDAMLSSVRSKPLTVAENNGASKALRLAIMAFASQWSHSQQAVRAKKSSFPESFASLDTLEDDIAESGDFERVLRQSLWNDAKSCIRRWSGCNSFRVILACMIFALVQKPWNEEEFCEVEDTWTAADLPDAGPTKIDVRNHYHASAQQSSVQLVDEDSLVAHQSWEEKIGAEDRVNHLNIALKQLKAWRPKVQALFNRTVAENQTRSQMPEQMPPITVPQTVRTAYSNFNVLFWLGVMCDTTSAVLHHRSLVIPDHETGLHIDLPIAPGYAQPAPTTTANIQTHSYAPINPPAYNPSFLWGSFLIESRKSYTNPFQNRNSSFAELAEGILRDAIPVKVLLWRKVGTFKTLIREQAQPQALEHCLNEALSVHHYWNAEYGEFFDDCIREHANLPFKMQSWYVILDGHWHLACLKVARCIEQIDEFGMSDEVQCSIRGTTHIALELQKDSAFAIARIARASCQQVFSPGRSPTDDFHTVVRQSALTSEPWTDVLNEALLTACTILLGWLNHMRNPRSAPSAEDIWIRTSLSYGELLQSCEDCIEALRILGRKSDIASLTATLLEKRLEGITTLVF